jgi:hypothetical protein
VDLRQGQQGCGGRTGAVHLLVQCDPQSLGHGLPADAQLGGRLGGGQAAVVQVDRLPRGRAAPLDHGRQQRQDRIGLLGGGLVAAPDRQVLRPALGRLDGLPGPGEGGAATGAAGGGQRSLDLADPDADVPALTSTRIASTTDIGSASTPCSSSPAVRSNGSIVGTAAS